MSGDYDDDVMQWRLAVHGDDEQPIILHVDSDDEEDYQEASGFEDDYASYEVAASADVHHEDIHMGDIYEHEDDNVQHHMSEILDKLEEAPKAEEAESYPVVEDRDLVNHDMDIEGIYKGDEDEDYIEHSHADAEESFDAWQSTDKDSEAVRRSFRISPRGSSSNILAYQSQLMKKVSFRGTGSSSNLNELNSSNDNTSSPTVSRKNSSSFFKAFARNDRRSMTVDTSNLSMSDLNSQTPDSMQGSLNSMTPHSSLSSTKSVSQSKYTFEGSNPFARRPSSRGVQGNPPQRSQSHQSMTSMDVTAQRNDVASSDDKANEAKSQEPSTSSKIDPPNSDSNASSPKQVIPVKDRFLHMKREQELREQERLSKVRNRVTPYNRQISGVWQEALTDMRSSQKLRVQASRRQIDIQPGLVRRGISHWEDITMSNAASHEQIQTTMVAALRKLFMLQHATPHDLRRGSYSHKRPTQGAIDTSSKSFRERRATYSGSSTSTTGSKPSNSIAQPSKSNNPTVDIPETAPSKSLTLQSPRNHEQIAVGGTAVYNLSEKLLEEESNSSGINIERLRALVTSVSESKKERSLPAGVISGDHTIAMETNHGEAIATISSNSLSIIAVIFQADSGDVYLAITIDAVDKDAIIEGMTKVAVFDDMTESEPIFQQLFVVSSQDIETSSYMSSFPTSPISRPLSNASTPSSGRNPYPFQRNPYSNAMNMLDSEDPVEHNQKHFGFAEEVIDRHDHEVNESTLSSNVAAIQAEESHSTESLRGNNLDRAMIESHSSLIFADRSSDMIIETHQTSWNRLDPAMMNEDSSAASQGSSLSNQSISMTVNQSSDMAIETEERYERDNRTMMNEDSWKEDIDSTANPSNPSMTIARSLNIVRETEIGSMNGLDHMDSSIRDNHSSLDARQPNAVDHELMLDASDEETIEKQGEYPRAVDHEQARMSRENQEDIETVNESFEPNRSHPTAQSTRGHEPSDYDKRPSEEDYENDYRLNDTRQSFDAHGSDSSDKYSRGDDSIPANDMNPMTEDHLVTPNSARRLNLEDSCNTSRLIRASQSSDESSISNRMITFDEDQSIAVSYEDDSNLSPMRDDEKQSLDTSTRSNDPSPSISLRKSRLSIDSSNDHDARSSQGVNEPHSLRKLFTEVTNTTQESPQNDQSIEQEDEDDGNQNIPVSNDVSEVGSEFEDEVAAAVANAPDYDPNAAFNFNAMNDSPQTDAIMHQPPIQSDDQKTIEASPYWSLDDEREDNLPAEGQISLPIDIVTIRHISCSNNCLIIQFSTNNYIQGADMLSNNRYKSSDQSSRVPNRSHVMIVTGTLKYTETPEPNVHAILVQGKKYREEWSDNREYDRKEDILKWKRGAAASGWMMKWPLLSQSFGLPSKRFFVLRGSKLSYYNSVPEASKPAEKKLSLSGVIFSSTPPVVTLNLSPMAIVEPSRKRFQSCVRVVTSHESDPEKDILWFKRLPLSSAVTLAASGGGVKAPGEALWLNSIGQSIEDLQPKSRFATKGLLESTWYHENKNVTCVAVDAIHSYDSDALSLNPSTYSSATTSPMPSSMNRGPFNWFGGNATTDQPHATMNTNNTRIRAEGSSPVIFISLYRQYLLEKTSNAVSLMDNALTRALTASMDTATEGSPYRGSILAFMGDAAGRRMSMPTLPRFQQGSSSFRVSELRYSIDIGRSDVAHGSQQHFQLISDRDGSLNLRSDLKCIKLIAVDRDSSEASMMSPASHSSSSSMLSHSSKSQVMIFCGGSNGYLGWAMIPLDYLTGPPSPTESTKRLPLRKITNALATSEQYLDRSRETFRMSMTNIPFFSRFMGGFGFDPSHETMNEEKGPNIAIDPLLQPPRHPEISFHPSAATIQCLAHHCVVNPFNDPIASSFDSPSRFSSHFKTIHLLAAGDNHGFLSLWHIPSNSKDIAGDVAPRLLSFVDIADLGGDRRFEQIKSLYFIPSYDQSVGTSHETLKPMDLIVGTNERLILITLSCRKGFRHGREDLDDPNDDLMYKFIAWTDLDRIPAGFMAHYCCVMKDVAISSSPSHQTTPKPSSTPLSQLYAQYQPFREVLPSYQETSSINEVDMKEKEVSEGTDEAIAEESIESIDSRPSNSSSAMNPSNRPKIIERKFVVWKLIHEDEDIFNSQPYSHPSKIAGPSSRLYRFEWSEEMIKSALKRLTRVGYRRILPTNDEDSDM